MDGILAGRPDDGWLWRGAEVVPATSCSVCYLESAVSAMIPSDCAFVVENRRLLFYLV